MRIKISAGDRFICDETIYEVVQIGSELFWDRINPPQKGKPYKIVLEYDGTIDVDEWWTFIPNKSLGFKSLYDKLNED